MQHAAEGHHKMHAVSHAAHMQRMLCTTLHISPEVSTFAGADVAAAKFMGSFTPMAAARYVALVFL